MKEIVEVLLGILAISNCVLQTAAYGPISRLIYPRNSILKAQFQSKDVSEKFCSIYYPNITSIPIYEEDTAFYYIVNGTDWDLCTHGIPPDIEITNRFVILDGQQSPNCTFMNQSLMIQNNGGHGAIFVSSTVPKPLDPIYYLPLNFTFISMNTSLSLLENEEGVEVGLYSSPNKFSLFNYSLIVIWFLAMFTVSIGSYWSAVYRYDLWISGQNDNRNTESPPDHDHAHEHERQQDEDRYNDPVALKEETSLNLSPKVIFFFVCMMCGMLLSLYFFYSYLVYLIITLFCIASVTAVFCCLYPLVKRIPCGDCRTPYFNIYFVRGTLELREILLLLFSISLTIVWVVLRNEPYAWILQDILGIAFSVNILKKIRLANLKMCTLLLTLLFFYDIFFVFITPLLTQDGNSIMVNVAQGGNSSEKLPMVLLVPSFVYPEVDDICDLPIPYNMIGFGDLIVPGLLISFVCFFDLKAKTPYRMYFVINIICYSIGLVVTFIVMYLMKYAQPALLYLVPFTLLPTVIIAACRGELSAMWQCNLDKHEIDDENEVPDDRAVLPSPFQ